MKVRILQRLDDNKTWFDDAYAVEQADGQVVFRYSLAWEYIGSQCAAKIRETGTSLDQIETIVPSGPGQRWLAVVAVDDDQAEDYLEHLNTICRIPRLKKVSVTAAA